MNELTTKIHDSLNFVGRTCQHSTIFKLIVNYVNSSMLKGGPTHLCYFFLEFIKLESAITYGALHKKELIFYMSRRVTKYTLQQMVS